MNLCSIAAFIAIMRGTLEVAGTDKIFIINGDTQQIIQNITL